MQKIPSIPVGSYEGGHQMYAKLFSRSIGLRTRCHLDHVWGDNVTNLTLSQAADEYTLVISQPKAGIRKEICFTLNKKELVKLPNGKATMVLFKWDPVTKILIAKFENLADGPASMVTCTFYGEKVTVVRETATSYSTAEFFKVGRKTQVLNFCNFSGQKAL